MADDELISPESENVLDDVFVLEVNDPYDIGSHEEMADVAVDPRDDTTVGFDSPEEIEQFLNELDSLPLSFQSAEERARLAGSLRAQLRSAIQRPDRPARLANEPYEFRLTPVTGINQAKLPKAGIIFPLPPEKYEFAKEQPPRTFTAINQQEYSLPGPKLLADYSLEGMFPYTNPKQWRRQGRPNFLPKYITAENYRTPNQMIGHLHQLKETAQPVLLTISPPPGARGRKKYGGLVGTNIVTVVSFTYGEAHGHVGDKVFTLALKQWRSIYTTIQLPGDPSPPGNGSGTSTPAVSSQLYRPPPIKNPDPAKPPQVNVYVVKSGDTLWDIAARELGTGTRWPEIYKLNAGEIHRQCAKHHVRCYPRGWHIFPGTRLKIPPRNKRDG